MTKRELSDTALRLIAQRFETLGEPLRLKLILNLMNGERNVSELVKASGATQANVSRHLQTLTEAGILKRRKEGLNVFYDIADPSVIQLCDLVCGSLEKHLKEQADAFGRASFSSGETV